MGGVAVSPSHPLSLAAPQSNKVPVVQHTHPMHPLTPLITYSNERFAPGSPPGHLPPDIDPKTGEGGGGQQGGGARVVLGDGRLRGNQAVVVVGQWERGGGCWGGLVVGGCWERNGVLGGK